MRTVRLLSLLAALLALAVTAGTAHSAASAPTGLHGFLLRADEPQQTSFPRTPSFAWNPVPGALSYEFQLSLSTTFRDNSVIYDDTSALTPVEAPPVTLPWITGSPHALYARVRATTPDGTTPWSANFGFDMVPPAPPTPLAGYPGLLRWTPVEGAAGYQVWLIDAHKMEYSATNTLDEREFYTFHPTQSWTGTVRWRIRALRDDLTVGGSAAENSIPAVTYGAWSPIYTSTNPAITGGPIKLVGTVSDVFSNGSSTSPAHELMPGFLWTGNQAIDGTSVELYRVYIFTDKQCLNRVYTSAIIGSPAYAPRPMGPLALPTTAAAATSARSQYLPDGTEPASFTYDGESVTTTESTGDATPTTTVPGAPGSTTPSSSGSSSTSSSDSSSSSAPASTSPSSGLTVNGRTGAPTDLWDTDWPSSGYYWTVVGVVAGSPGSVSTSVGSGGGALGSAALSLTNSTGLNPGDVISIGSGPTAESDTITAISGDTVTLASVLKFGHGFGEPVTRTGGGFQYTDVELPQDVCAAGRVMRFGKESEPSLTAGGELFASGLSSDGRLASAVHTTAFYGQPLVSWTPALGAEVYEVQWSKTQYPFTPEAASTGALGIMTGSTSVVLPVGPGTWWYRVRGFDYSLPSGAQQMSWSDPAELVVAKPQFKVVGSTATSSAGKTSASATLRAGSVSVTVPAGWAKQTLSGQLLAATHGSDTALTVAKKAGRGALSVAQWTQALVADAKSNGALGLKTQTVSEPGGQAVYLSFQRADKTGKMYAMREYYFDAGAASYLVVLDTTSSLAPSLSATFTKIAASFRHP